MALPGVFVSKKKNGEVYYRTSITYRNKHISLGSYNREDEASKAYWEAKELLDSSCVVEDYPDNAVLSFSRWVVLLNFKDNGLYFKNPIYLKKRFFLYYLDADTVLKFDAEDLFYYAHHKIMVKGGYWFVSDYGMQINILARYGVKNFAVCGRDYRFINNDNMDFRYGNIEIINPYHGVTICTEKKRPYYLAKIHVNGDIIVGRYDSDKMAAIAYNKAVHHLQNKGIQKNFPKNYISELEASEYQQLYKEISISKSILHYNP